MFIEAYSLIFPVAKVHDWGSYPRPTAALFITGKIVGASQRQMFNVGDL